MSEKEQMNLLVKNAQEALGRVQQMVLIPGLWDEFQSVFNSALRFANNLASVVEKTIPENEKLTEQLQRTTAAYTSIQEKSKEREEQLKAIYGPVQEENANLRQEVQRLQATIAEYKTHPAVIEAELAKNQAEIESTERRLLSLKIAAAEKAAALQRINPVSETKE